MQLYDLKLTSINKVKEGKNSDEKTKNFTIGMAKSKIAEYHVAQKRQFYEKG